MKHEDMTAYERGEWDCVHGYAVRDDEIPDYYSGYGDAYAKEQSATWYSEQKFLNIMGASE